MVRRILMTLMLLALTAAVSVGLLQAQGSTESERPPYRIDLHPGWNLISLPSDPVDMSLEHVMGDSHVDMVLGYQNDQWEAAVRSNDGGWRTTSGLTTMSSGRGYWLHALADDAIETRLSPSESGALSISIIPGWNLVGVVDAEQRPPGAAIDADDYFTNVDWRVAYTYRPDTNLWTKLIPSNDGTVVTGAGYWVWNTSPGSCPPVSGAGGPRGSGATAGVGAGYQARVSGVVALSCP